MTGDKIAEASTSGIDFKAMVEYAKRVGTGLDEQSLDDIGEQTSLRQFDVSDRTVHRFSAIANANSRVVNPALSVIVSTALGKFQLTSFLDALQEVRLADLQAERYNGSAGDDSE